MALSVYSWKRYWGSRTARLDLADSGYLGDPETDALVAPMGLGVQVNRNSRPSVHWVSTSLLSSLTTMLLEDLAKGTALRCPCGQLFVSNAYQARYHSKQCRWRFEKHKQRHLDED